MYEAYIILKLDAVFSPLFQPVFDKNPEFCQKKKSEKIAPAGCRRWKQLFSYVF